MDNRIFYVNGKSVANLEKAIELACLQVSWSEHPEKIKSYTIDTEYGAVLYSNNDGTDRFPHPIGADQAAAMFMNWIKGLPEEDYPTLGDFEVDIDQDGHNDLGWSVFIGDWGKIRDKSAICVIKPCFIWYGK